MSHTSPNFSPLQRGGTSSAERGETWSLDLEFPRAGRWPTLTGLEALAIAAARRWASRSVSVSDHIVIPRSIESRYPYNETGEFAGGPTGECLEQLTMLSFLAGVTSSARLLTSVMVLPHRSPVAGGEDDSHGGRAVRRAGDPGVRRGLDARGVRGHRRASLRRAGRGGRRVHPRVQGALDQRRPVV